MNNKTNTNIQVQPKSNQLDSEQPVLIPNFKIKSQTPVDIEYSDQTNFSILQIEQEQ